MADIPELRSKEQIAGDLIDGILARLRKDIDLNQGSVLTQLVEAISQNLFKGSADVIAMIDAQSIDRAEGEALQRLAKDKQVPIFPATASTGQVTITDTSFEKKATRIYSGQPAPVAGSLKLYVADASNFQSANGKIYLGRGTTNVEGPLDYTSVQSEAGGAYWSITLATTSPTTKFHNIGETVVMAQGGNRIINAGSSLKTVQGFSVASVDFKTTALATIIDGETVVSSVPVKCEQLGEIGNIPRGAIKEAVGIPFSVTVFNDNAFTNGREADTDDDIKARIKAYEQAKPKGTVAAIEYYSNGVVAKDELKKVTSAKVIEYSDSTSSLVFDDGSGYEPNFIGASYETVIDEAIGGETEAQMRQKPISQARIINVFQSPYNLENISTLSVIINNTQKTHYFNPTEFKVPSSASAFEVMSSINGNPNIHFNASTANGGKNLVIYPREKTSNNIMITASSGVDANAVLGFPLTQSLTLRLYKNDLPLYQDGYEARIYSKLKSEWLTGISSGDTLSYIVDGTVEITATFNTVDFQKVDLQASVSVNTAIETWAAVFNAKLPGVITTIVGERIAFTSARGINNSASIEFTGGTLLAQIFDVDADLYTTGREADYTLNPQTGQIGFTRPLLPKDKITAGSRYARGSLTSGNISAGPGTNGRLWVVADGDVQNLPNELTSTSIVSFSKVGTKLTISASGAFAKAQKNDWLIVWANPTDSTLKTFQGFWKIENLGTGSITVDDGTDIRPSANLTINPNRVVILRTKAPVQELDFISGSLADFISQIKSQLTGVDVDVIGTKIRLSTSTLDENGELYIAAADEGGQTLGFTAAMAVKNTPSHYGFVVKTDSEVGFPSFTHGVVGAIIDSETVTDSSYENLGGNRSDFIEILPKHDTANKAEMPESNKNRRVFVSDFDAALSRLHLIPPSYMDISTVPSSYYIALPENPHRSVLQQDDRYILRSPYSFDSNDTAIVIADTDVEVKTYTLPVSRKIIVSNNSTPSIQDFSASDAESSLDLFNPSSFYDFSFNDFKVFRQAHATLTNGTYGIKFKSADFGPAGDKMRIGFVYPESAEKTELSHNFMVSDSLGAEIHLPAKDVRVPNWDYTTSFIVTVSISGAKKSLTFTYGAGTKPDFSLAGAEVHLGDVAFIGNTDFYYQNRNIKGKVTAVTATSFTIEVPYAVGGYLSDAMTFSAIDNQNGIITFTTSNDHNVTTGQMVGIFNTAISSGTIQPLNGAYIATKLDSNRFTVNAPSVGIGGTLVEAVQGSNLATITTSIPHNLNVGNIIKISGTNDYDGVFPVYNVINSYKFQYVKTVSAPTKVNVGRVDFQSQGIKSTASISTLSKVNSTVTITTSTAHNLFNGEIAQISGVEIAAWASATTYGVNDLVKYNGTHYYSKYASNQNHLPDYSVAGWQQISVESWISSRTYYIGDVVISGGIYYIALGTNTGKVPNSYPADWYAISVNPWSSSTTYNATSLGPVVVYNGNYYKCLVTNNLDVIPGTNFSWWVPTTQNLMGSFVISYVSPTQFTYAYPLSGASSGTGGSSSKMGSQGSLARAIGGQAAENLQFASVEATVQQVLDYVSTNLSSKFSASLASGLATAKITSSTEDNLISSNYLSGSVTKVVTRANSRLLKFATSILIPAGSNVNVIGVGGFYDGNYVVLNSYYDSSTSENIMEVHCYWMATVNQTVYVNPSSTILRGSTKMLMLKDGENSVKTTNLFAPAFSPMLQMKQPWTTPPSVGEELRLVAVTADHLNRFWNKLVVTGLSNVANINLAKYGRQLQISTKQFGASGSIQVAGGTSNKLEVAAIASGQIINYKLGAIQIPFDIKKGFMPNQWITVSNNIRQNKQILFNPDTVLSLNSVDGYLYSNGYYIFQTKRTTTQSAGTQIKIEKHGDFLAFIGIGSLSLENEVKEGDWVVIKNSNAALWVSSTSYVAGDRVSYNGNNYTALNNNANAQPDINPLNWELRQFNKANIGTYQVVRTFGSQTFWIKNDGGLEEMAALGLADDLSFYSYDSVMPGDTLVINTTLFGSDNVGRYTVLGPNEDPSLDKPFPTNLKIYIQPPNSTSNLKTLGGENLKINIEAKSPLTLYKRVFAVGPSSDSYATLMTDTPELMDRISSSLGAGIIGSGKLGFNEDINFGIDAYKYYIGLIKELNKIIYGDAADPINYPGVRASGTYIDIKEAIIRRITASFSVRVKTGVPFTEIRDNVKAAVAGYVNSLGVGESVSISRMIAAAGNVPGVVAVSVTYPTYSASNDLITVSSFEKAYVIDSTVDITVSVISN